MKTAVWLLLLCLFPAAAPASEQPLAQPSWSFEVKGGVFAPRLQDWSSYYGGRDIPQYAASLAYKVLPWFDLGIGAGTMSTRGFAYYLQHGNQAGEATYELRQVNAFIMLRGAVKEDQLLVPYVAGGWTRMYYREKVPGRETIRGSADGYHVRAGLQLSLDNLDTSASTRMFADYGVYHTYFFIEAEYTRVLERTTSIDLGGTAYLGGLLFEF